ncbi:MAG TPA: hypothetical protein VNA20_01455 [Frankiaceae bacterium]|nr:hypothetical protein [Frankiaceae bacterium]
MTRTRLAARGALVTALAAGLLGAGALLTAGAPPPSTRLTGRGGPARVAPAGAGGVAALQARLDRVPGDSESWAALGAAYVQQARVSADPSLYPRADAAVARSLSLRPAGDNAPALTARATLAAARHDFAAAHRDALAARRLNPYNATTLGVLADALVELGRYDAAFRTIQRMVDLRPDIASFTRVSYSFELRGDPAGAEYALRRALAVVTGPADRAFVEQYLGELAWSRGDVATARRHYDAGLRATPNSAALLVGRAKARAAAGDTAGAVADYDTVLARLPLPEHAVAYADLLASLGRSADAARVREVADGAVRLLATEGVNADLEVAIYEADHGSPARAVAAARREYAKRRSIHVEDAYAWALHAAGRDREALPHARRAVRLGTRDASFRYHLGVIEAALGLRAPAARNLTEALALNPHFSPTHAARARRMLASLR